MRSLRYLGALMLTLTLTIPAFASEEATPLLEAMAYLDPRSDPVSASFVDWSQLKRLHGGGDVTSGSPLQERQRLMLDIARSEATPVELGIDRLATWPEAWGWDNTDLDWETRVFGALVVLRFGEHWDALSFREALQGFGYEAREFRGGVLYVPDDGSEMPSRLRLARVWGLEAGGPEMSTPGTRVAISDDGRTVVLSPFRGVAGLMRLAQRTDPAEVAASPYGRAATALDRPLAASIWNGRYACHESQNESLTGEPAAIAASVAPLRHYEALAAGYSRADAGASPIGRFVFAYPRPWQARDDLPGRRLLIEEGYLRERGSGRYSDVAFTLADAWVDGSQLILDVEPLEGVPKLVLDQVQARPTLFAMCGPVPDQPT
jgi:hypothetical protein